MANQKMENIKSLGQNPRTRFVLIVTVVAVVGAVVVGKMATSSKSSRPADLQAEVSVGKAPSVKAVPGTSTSARHTELVREANKQDADSAKATGETVIPRLTADVESGRNPFDLVEKAPQDAQTGTVQLEVKKVAQNQPAPAPAPVMEKSRALLEQEAAMSAAMTGLLNAWAPVGQKIEMDHTGTNKGQPEVANGAMTNPGVASGQTVSAPATPADVKAGTVMHAVAITSVNSDEPGPVLAEIISGPYAGSRLLGTFTRPQNAETVVLQFKTISMKSAKQSYAIDAYAVNPETARTAMATDVDHHYFQRYGLLFASAFVKGYGQALAQSGQTQTTTVGTGGAVTNTVYPELNAQDKALVALGEVGAEFSSVLKESAQRPITVKLESGTPMGILFMADAAFGK